MAKTFTEYESSDIDLKGNKTHEAIYMGLIMSAFVLTAPPTEGKTREEQHDANGQSAVAVFLTLMEKSGLTLVKAETVPPVFDDVFKR